MRQLVLKNVLVATDFTDESAGAVQTAAALAGLAGARLHVVHAARPDERDVEARLREHVARLSPEAGDAAIIAPAGPAEEVILQAAERTRADVIVLGPHRRHDSRALGSTADRVVRGAQVPLLIVPRALELPLRRVVAAIDLSDSGRGALLVALTWGSALRRPSMALGAGEPRTRLDALHVLDGADPSGMASVGEYVGTVRGEMGAYVGVEIEEVSRDGGGSPAGVARAVMEYAAASHADLLVAGTRSLGSADAPSLGSVSSALVRDTPTPVLVVPPAVWRHANTPSTPPS